MSERAADVGHRDGRARPGLDVWLRGELARLGRARPRIARALVWTWAHPVPVLMLLDAVIVGSLGAAIAGGDALLFRSSADAMLGRHFFDVFEQAGLQVGPVYLVVLALLDRLVRLLHLPELFTLAAVQSAAIVWFATWTARRAAVLARVPARRAQWAVGLVLVFGGFLAEAMAIGHPEEILVGLLAANAALSAASGRHAVAGALIGLATGVKQWGPLAGGVVLLGRPRARSVAVGGAFAVLVVAVLYAPFAVWGHIATFGFTWGIPRSSLLGLVGGWAGASDWDLRLVQGALAGLVGAALAWRGRGSPLVPVISAVAVRLLLDPLRLTYYSGPFVVVALVWLWVTDVPLVRRWRLAITCATPAVVLSPYLLPPAVLWWCGTLGLVAATAAVVLCDRLARHPRAGAGTPSSARGRAATTASTPEPVMQEVGA